MTDSNQPSDGFQFYEGSRTESADLPRITVRRGGLLVLTQAAAAKLGDAVERVQLGYNAQARAIGLRALPQGASGGYRLRTQANSLARLVDARRLFAHHDLPADKARSYDVGDFGHGVIGLTLGTLSAGKEGKESKVDQTPATAGPTRAKRRTSAKSNEPKTAKSQAA